MRESSAQLARLRLLAAAPTRSREDGDPADWLGAGLPRAKVHELFATEPVDATATAGFGVAMTLAAGATPLLWLRTEAAERQGGRLHASGLLELGLDPAALVLALVHDEAALLRAAGDAARCPGLGALVVEAWGRAAALDLTVTRRLQLAAEASGVTILLLRVAGAPAPSAAATRWGVAACPSTALAADAPGRPAYLIELQRRRGGPAGQRWRVEWDRDTKASTPRRYLALVFPWLPIERLRSTRPHLFVGRADAPIAFTETVGNAVRLAALDLAAAQTGLEVGLTLADARARVPELDVYPHDPHADADWLERLGEACGRYSPAVALDPPDGLVLDIAGCVHAFEGERPLAADVERRMARRGVLVRHAFGDTPEIARALARFAGAPAPDEKGAVRRLPVAALGLDADATTALARAGLKTVGDVMARPLAGLAARFGEQAVTAVRQLSGDARSPIVARRPDIPVVVERRFAEPIARTDYALEVLADLAAEAAGMLAQRHQGGRRWEARLYRADGQVQRLRVETGRPTRDMPLLMRLFRERIDTLADPFDPGFGYDTLQLDVVLAERLDASQLKLEGGQQKTGDMPALIDQLSTRLGRVRVRRFAARDSHIPEQAELTLPAAAPAQSGAWRASAPGEPPLRPIHLFDPPERIESVMAEVPDGPPRRFRWRRTLHEVARAEGPERIAGEWWRRQDAGTSTRDYYRVEDRRGRRFWIFRHDRPDTPDPSRWYLHGLFA